MFRILIFNLPPLAYHALTAVLDDQPDIQVIGYAASESEVRDLTSKSNIISVKTPEAGPKDSIEGLFDHVQNAYAR